MIPLPATGAGAGGTTSTPPVGSQAGTGVVPSGTAGTAALPPGAAGTGGASGQTPPPDQGDCATQGLELEGLVYSPGGTLLPHP
jgi:hypothetical protein